MTDSSTITYQVPRNVLIRIWWRRMIFRPTRLISLGFLAVMGIGCFILRQLGGGDPALNFLGTILLTLVIVFPLNIYRVIAKAIDDNAQFTDRKTLEFGPTQLLSSGPNWKSELPWSRFLGFSEDKDYFYLHLSRNGIASVIPKAAFTPEQREKFSLYANAAIGHLSR